MSITNMNPHKQCDHSSCSHATANLSVHQTLSEMDWERGIWNAAFNDDIEKVQKLINQSRDIKETVNAQDNAGYTALHYAARKGNLEICKLLVDNGAEIDSVTRGNATPLHKAAAAGKVEAVQFFIKKCGANASAQDDDGETALHKAAANKHKAVFDTLLVLCPELSQIKNNKGCLA